MEEDTPWSSLSLPTLAEDVQSSLQKLLGQERGAAVAAGLLLSAPDRVVTHCQECYSLVGVPHEEIRTMASLEYALNQLWEADNAIIDPSSTETPSSTQGSKRQSRRRQGQAAHPQRQPTNNPVHQPAASNQSPAGPCFKTDVVVVGAGSNGLAAAACLKEEGLATVVFERSARVGDVWRARYDRLHIHNYTDACDLPFMPQPEVLPAYMGKDQMAQYMEAYALLMGLDIRTEHEVASAVRDEAGQQWTVVSRNSDGHEATWQCKVLLIATGLYTMPHVPAIAGLDSFQGHTMHSTEYTSGKDFIGQRVLVVGAGNSGCEQALDLWEHGALPTMVIRTPPVVTPRWVMGWHDLIRTRRVSTKPANQAVVRAVQVIMDGIYTWAARHTYQHLEASCGLALRYEPISKYTVRNRAPPVIDVGTMGLLQKGEIAVIQDEIDHFTPHGVVFSSGQEESADAVLWATGFKPGLESSSFASFLGSMLEQLHAQSQSDCHFMLDDPNPLPGLYFAMNPSLQSPKSTAPSLAAQITKHVLFPVHKMVSLTTSQDKKEKLQRRLRALKEFKQQEAAIAQATAAT